MLTSLTINDNLLINGLRPEIEEEDLEDDDEENEEEDEWFEEEYEGELSIDVYQTAKDIIIKSTIAGVRPEDIDIAVSHDLITIRGKRHQGEEVNDDDYFFQECYWGGFSRSIILPQAVKTDQVQASLENGILTVILPKVTTPDRVKIEVKDLNSERQEIMTEIN